MYPYIAAARLAGLFALVAAGPIPTIEVSKGVHLPMLNLGGVNATLDPMYPDASNYSLWLELGGRGFDTAWEYQTSGAISAAIHTSGLPRSEIFITHKIPGSLAHPCTGIKCQGFPEPPPVTGHYTPAMARRYLADNLKRLGTEIGHIDLLLLHEPCNYGGKFYAADECAAIYEVMEEALRDGTTRAIGVSNHNSAALEALLQRVTVKPAVNQCRMAVGEFDKATYTFCQQHGITYQAYSPLHTACTQTNEMKTIAAAHNHSVYEVALRWIVQHQVPIVTASNKSSHMTSDMSIFGFTLTDEEMATLNSLNCKKESIVV